LSRTLAAATALVALVAASGLRAQEEPQPDPATGIVASLTLFAGTRTGLWHSGDWGGTWERLRAAPSGDSLEATGAVHDILTTTSGVYVAAEAGLFVSGDFGYSWKHHAVEAPALAVMPTRFPNADPTILVGTASGLLRSPDAGKTFEPTALAGTGVRRLLWPGPALVVATDSGVQVSLDSGDHFDAVGRGLPRAPAIALVVSSLYALDPVILAGVEGEGVYRSSDGGASWTRAGLEGVTVNDLFWFGPLLYAATERGLYRSQNAGEDFEPLGRSLEGVACFELMFPRYPDSGVELFVTTERGLYRSLDGGMLWEPSGLADEALLSIATFPPPSQLRDER
jgi:photosystem II stability/assembly factor-like uncharacterized protein